MGIPVLKAQDVPTKLPGNKGEAVIQAELVVDGVSWNVTCVSMGNPHCITFGTKGGPVRACLHLLDLSFCNFYQHMEFCFCSLFCNFPLCQKLKVDDLNLPEIGPKFEHHEMFPARTNTG